jgi:amino acid transporter
MAMITSAVTWITSIFIIQNPTLGSIVFPSRPVDPLVLLILIVSTIVFSSSLVYFGIRKIWFEG